jgi:hypothetical protein
MMDTDPATFARYLELIRSVPKPERFLRALARAKRTFSSPSSAGSGLAVRYRTGSGGTFVVSALNQDTFDGEYLRRWAAQLQASDLLDRFSNARLDRLPPA